MKSKKSLATQVDFVFQLRVKGSWLDVGPYAFDLPPTQAHMRMQAMTFEGEHEARVIKRKLMKIEKDTVLGVLDK